VRQASEAPEPREGQGRSLSSGLVIAGPTGSGKTSLAAAIAAAKDGELVSADSRQVYQGFDAGTNKERPAGIAMHLLDVAMPADPFSAGRFLEAAVPVIREIRSRRHLPIVVGGTGLYIKALLEGLSILPQRDAAVRARLESEWEAHGDAALRERLVAVDPKAASSIPVGNKQRLIRALEVFELTGRPITQAWEERQGAAEGPWLSFVIHWPSEELKRRLLARCAALWRPLVEETRRLRETLTGEEPAFQGLGYREALAFIEGRMLETEAYAAFEKDTLAYAKRQRTWFNNQLKNAIVIEGGPTERMLEQALQHL
jgi:tRNA dimethylallyltransferase